MDYVMNIISVVLNSNVALEIGVIVAAYVYVKYLRTPSEKYIDKYEWVQILRPYVIEGIKFAEKSIPDDTTNKTIKKADTAFKFILSVVEQTNKPEDLPSNLGALIRFAISEIHRQMDEDGKLPFSPELVEPSQEDSLQDKVPGVPEHIKS